MNSDKVTVVNPAMEISSGIAEPSEGNLKKLTNYLHALAGHIDNEMSTVFIDHCYARAWNWKPESIYVKPMKKIFFSKNYCDSNG